MDAATFRSDFPEFTDSSRFPDAQVNFWLGLGEKQLPESRWADLRDQGLELFVAHNLVLAAQAEKAKASGGLPGASSGVTSSKSVDKVSVSYDTGASLIDGAGHWNLTTYGTRFLWLARMIGVSAVSANGTDLRL